MVVVMNGKEDKIEQKEMGRPTDTKEVKRKRRQKMSRI
jgi:hypothetical protein